MLLLLFQLNARYSISIVVEAVGVCLADHFRIGRVCCDEDLESVKVGALDGVKNPMLLSKVSVRTGYQQWTHNHVEDVVCLVIAASDEHTDFL